MFDWLRARRSNEPLTAEETGIENAETREMIENIMEFSGKTAEDVAVHRREVVAIPADAEKDEIMRALLGSRYSRFPVYEGSMDNVVGILNAKDVFRALVSVDGEVDQNFDIMSILRKPYFVPISKSADALFAEMRKNKLHMAIIVDEYGGTAGLVTMEDLIEEITGNILDEYDEEEKPQIERVSDSVFKVDGKTPLEECEEIFGVQLPTDEFDTMGGFVIGLLGRVPAKDEKPETEFEGLVFKVTGVRDNRVLSMTVELPHEQQK